MNSFSLLFLKVLLSAGMVIGITLTAERVSTRLAGVLIGFPLGAGLTLFFLGLEQGEAFAAESALWSIQGILAALGFCWCYRKGALWFHGKTWVSLCLSCITGLAGFFTSAIVLKYLMPGNPVLRTCMVILLLFIPAVAFRKASEKKIKKSVSFSLPMLLCRAGFAALVILGVTGIAASVGPVWSGMLATFPTVILPSVVILHYHYGSSSVPAFFRDTPLAMLAIIVFSLSVHWTFPLFGVLGGTLFSYSAALIYLLIYEIKLRAVLDHVLPS